MQPRTNEDGYALVLASISKAELARKLGISRMTVHNWGESVPIEYVLRVEEVTGIAREQIAPTFFRPQTQRKTS